MTLALSTAEIVERFKAGETMPALALRYGCHVETIRYRLNRAGACVRKRVNARVMLATHKPVLLDLLAQLEKTLEAVRAQFGAEAGNRERRQKYLARIERLEGQILALRAVTNK